MTATRAVWLFLTAITLLRLSMIATTELSGDEAHYWMWSERLAPGYFSKGPGVAFAIAGGTALFGDNEFGVRFWSPILAAATSLLLFYFTRRLFDATAGFWVVLGLNVTPIFNMGSLVMTIDPLSVFFWTAAMFSFWLATERSPAFSWWWVVTGFLVGLGFLCKYTNALELIAIMLVMAAAPRLREHFTRVHFYLMLIAFAICTVPPIMWNKEHAWITLIHLRSTGGLSEDQAGFRPLEVFAFLGQHFLAYSPLLFAGLIWAILRKWRRAGQQFKVLFLFWFGVPVFALYLLLSVNGAVAMNWTSLAFISLAVLAVSYWQPLLEERKSVRWLAGAAVALSLAMTAALLNLELLGWTNARLAHKTSARIHGWRATARAVENVRDQLERQLGEKLFLIADERDRASELSFYLGKKRLEGRGHPAVYIPESQDLRNQFAFWPRYDEFVAAGAAPTPAPDDPDPFTEQEGVNLFLGRSALYIRQGKKEKPPRAITGGFGSSERVARIEVRRRGRTIRELQVFLCRNYRTMPL